MSYSSLKFVRFLSLMATLFAVQLNAIAQAKKSENIILIVGDSLSMGYGVALKNIWVTILKKHILQNNYPYKIVNASIGGDTTLSGLNRLPNSLIQHKPKIVILELGANDGLRGLSLQQTRINIEKMIKLIRGKKIQVLLIGMQLPPNYGPAYTKKFKQIYFDLANKYNVEFLPFMLTGVAGIRNYVQADGIHPNTQAQPFVFRNIWGKLEAMLEREVKKSSS